MAITLRSLLCVASLLVIGAGAGSGSAVGDSTADVRGQLLAPPDVVGTYTVSDLLAKLTDGWLTRELLEQLFSPVCSVDAYHLQYVTVGGQGEPTTASAALMIPSGSDPACQGPRPVVLYAHGKRDLKFYNIANLNLSSNYEGLLLAISCAAHGYIVVAPNYAGYDTSALSYHPYLNGEQQAADMMDALTAARIALPQLNGAAGSKLFVTGYSQGGYVAMATHKAMELAGIPVTGSVPMSGPYALSAFGDAVFTGYVDQGATEQFVLLASSYQHAYGNLYSAPTEVFEAKYAADVETLLPSMVGTDTLVSQGLLPTDALFSITPPEPALASMTPPRKPKVFEAVFASGFGADDLVTNAYRLEYLQDAASSPDGGWPNTTTATPPENPSNGFRVDLKTNDLRNWVPTAPTLLCGGNQDPVVYFFNTLLMQSYWATHAPAGTPVTYLDVDSKGGPYSYIKDGFRATKDIVELAAFLQGQNSNSAVLDQYHAVLVPAFCLQAARAFFDSH